MTNDILIKQVRGEKFQDQLFWIFYRQGEISDPLFITTDAHARKLAKQILGVPEDQEIHRVDHPLTDEPEMCGWCKKEEATNSICHRCWRRLG